jgi:hypothetical protein
MKEEALKLADELDKLSQYVPSEAPDMIRRLVEELDKPHKYDPETGEPLIDGWPLYSALPSPRELSDEEIIKEIKLLPQLISMEDKDFIKFARAIEERHGIK